MTITYTLEVSRARFWGFVKLLGRWKGSVYRLIYREMCAFLVAYYIIAFTYRYSMSPAWQTWFESFAIYCRELLSVVPITFILGFYLSFVVGRWWQQYMAIPWPDRLAIQISAFVQGNDERGRIIRRSLVRYLNLISVLTFQQTSTIIKCRFPTLDHMVEAGIMTSEEKTELENTPTPHGIWWVPAQWFGQLAMKARKEGRIHDDLHLKSLIDEMIEFRGMCGTIWSYDWISVPLSYTQVVAIAVYSFFVSCLFGRQYLFQNPQHFDTVPGFDVDFYFPVFTIFQFVFYVGWLKVAEGMICPFGEDDDDFELNWIIDRNIQVSYLIVDQMYMNGPKVGKDALWGEVETDIPYTQAAANYRQAPYFGSTQAMNITDRQAEWNVPEQMPIIDEEAGATMRGSKDGILGLSREALKFARRRKKKIPKDEKSIDNIDEIDNRSDSVGTSDMHSDHSSDEEDRHSTGSTQVDERNKRRRLGDLLPGYSRTNLASRLGSKLSLNSLYSNRKRTSYKAKTSPSIGRNKSASRGRLIRHLSRASSPGHLENNPEVTFSDIGPLMHSSQQIDETTNTDTNPQLSHLSSFAPIQIDVPPPLAEEPEQYYNNSGSGSDTTSQQQQNSHSSGDPSISTSRTLLIPNNTKES
ncbi:unnamed protein product [Bursaphelenchus okinawaensis]|uniref:Bestrophin homolog n=1 Tax=Bursaphelenchus okinawaensis TaxID=465554 RepID=A0A811LMI7_9BILA|nr:unnamed protein product [Bursaphelenchus okinawaensis]CAG9126770.1 unnamed protein product [Bursaphelenchus okinawaensis]